ncbi:MAG: hypothetical protein NTW07_09835, partial [candidate division Zixibacteria bacterium]|nr:hypothetical protein [candidate division Zixibacteria bacterium]
MPRLCLALLILFGICQPVAGQYIINQPETVIYDSAYQRYLVSNMVNGDIVQIDRYGSYSIFSDVLQRVHGMAISGNTLYVSSNAGSTAGVVGFDLTTAEIVYQLPTVTYGENGLATDTSGHVFISD